MYSVAEQQGLVLRDFVQVHKLHIAFRGNFSLNGRYDIANVVVAYIVNARIRVRNGTNNYTHIRINRKKFIKQVVIRRRKVLLSGSRIVGRLRVVCTHIDNSNIGHYCLYPPPLLVLQPRHGFAVSVDACIRAYRPSALAEVDNVVRAAELVLKLRGIAFRIKVACACAFGYGSTYRRNNGHVFYVGICNRLNLEEIASVPHLCHKPSTRLEAAHLGMLENVVGNCYLRCILACGKRRALAVDVQLDRANRTLCRRVDGFFEFDIYAIPLAQFKRGRYARGRLVARGRHRNTQLAVFVRQAVTVVIGVVLSVRIEPQLEIVRRLDHKGSIGKLLADVDGLVCAVELDGTVVQSINYIAAVVRRAVVVGHILPIGSVVYLGVQFRKSRFVVGLSASPLRG